MDGSRVLSQSTNDTAYEIGAGNTSWINYTVQADVKNMPEAAGGGFGIMGRRLSSSKEYFLTLANGHWKLSLNNNGVWSVPATSTYSYSTGVWYTLSMTFSGATITVAVDGVTQGSITDTTVASGAIGLRAFGHTEFANVRVTAL